MAFRLKIIKVALIAKESLFMVLMFRAPRILFSLLLSDNVTEGNENFERVERVKITVLKI
jgi:hypothetical protein